MMYEVYTSECARCLFSQANTHRQHEYQSSTSRTRSRRAAASPRLMRGAYSARPALKANPARMAPGTSSFAGGDAESGAIARKGKDKASRNASLFACRVANWVMGSSVGLPNSK